METKAEKELKQTFTRIYKNNHWQSPESSSGRGSTLAYTTVVRHELPKLFARLDVRTVLDIPCGDYWWFKEIDTPVDYIGADIVPELIAENRRNYPHIDFRVLDATKDKLPKVDLIFCRDMLGHLSNKNIKLALVNMQKSGSKYLLATTFPSTLSPIEIKTGDWRRVNLTCYGLPKPIKLINERHFKKGHIPVGKYLGLWKLEGYGGKASPKKVN